MRFLDGELSAEERARVDRHVTKCTRLQKEIDFFRAIGSDLQTLPLRVEIPRQSIWELISPKLPQQKGTR